MRSLLIVALIAIGPIRLSAQDGVGIQLRAALSLKCEFPRVASFDPDVPDPTPKLGQQSFGFVIDGIDYTTHKARLIGNAGTADLVIVNGLLAVTFIEVTPASLVNTTTVYPDSAPGGQGFRAVTSRHWMVPSQAYGYCKTWD